MKTRLMITLAIVGITIAACNSNRNDSNDAIDTGYIDTTAIDTSIADTTDNLYRGNNSMGGPDTVGVTPQP